MPNTLALKALLLSFLSVLFSSRGQHWAVAAPASSQPATSVPWHQESAATLGRPHPECRAHLTDTQRQHPAQPPLHLWPQVWMGWGVKSDRGCDIDIDFRFTQFKGGWFIKMLNKSKCSNLSEKFAHNWGFYESASETDIDKRKKGRRWRQMIFLKSLFQFIHSFFQRLSWTKTHWLTSVAC